MDPALWQVLWGGGAPAWVQRSAAVDLDFASSRYYGGSLASLLSTTRAQTVSSYATTSTGALTAFAANTPRITDLGLLVEEARTNLALQSQTIGATGWTATGISATTNNAGAPDGTSTLNILTEDTSTGKHGYYQTVGVTVTSGQTGTLSAYIKAGTRRYIVLEINSTVANYSGAVVDTVSWTITGYNAGTGVAPTVSLTQLGSTGTYRAVVTGSVSGVTTYFPALGGTLSSSGASGFNTSYTGTSATIQAWGLQFEAGSFPTSYIPTTTVAITRNADAATLLRTGITRVVFTFSDGTTQTVTGISAGSQYAIPTTLNKPVIARLTGYAS